MQLKRVGIAAAVLLAVGLVLAGGSGALAAPPWPDAPAEWWVESYGITEAQVGTVADGYLDGTFRPGEPVTRGQFAKMTVKGLGVAMVNPVAPTFEDVPEGHTFYPYVESASAAELILGYSTSNGLYYRPDRTITRQQAFSILGRYLSQVEIECTGNRILGDVRTYGSLDLWYQAEGEFYLADFADRDLLAPDHRATTAYLVWRGVLEGDKGSLKPTASLIRSQAAALTLRVQGKAADMRTLPPSPTDLALEETGTAVTVTKTGPTAYVGNDPTPRVTGLTVPVSNVRICDAPFYGEKPIKFEISNRAGLFFVDLDSAVYPLFDGMHSFTAQVMSLYGQWSPPSEPVTYLLDRVPPTGVITAPALLEGRDYAAVNSPKPVFVVEATDQASGVESVQFQVAEDIEPLDWKTISVATAPDPGTDSDTTTTYTAVWPSFGELGSGLSDGEYQFRAVITDAAGNECVVEPIAVKVDTVAPTVTITAPENGEICGTQPLFTATAEDVASGVREVIFQYSTTDEPDTWITISTDSAAPYEAASYEADWGSVELTEGATYYLRVVAYDNAGHFSTSALIEISVSTGANSTAWLGRGAAR